MDRMAMAALMAWKARVGHKPLVIRGARQVGKTWLMKAFGAAAYEQVVYVNFDHNAQMKALFEGGVEVERLLSGLSLYAGHKIEAQTTLLIFDEVQEVPAALASLKYFNENAPEYDIVCAGSLLGVALHEGTSFPVGKVEFLDLYPMSFFEFLQAMEKPMFAEVLQQGDFAMAETFKADYELLLKQYYYVGGMPEAVQAFAARGDYNEVRQIQQRILTAYEQDFSKHASYEVVPRLRMLWQSVPGQLAKENKKFIYGQVREGARAKDYELVLLWLSDCGLVHRVHRVSAPRLPLSAYEDLKAFKLYLLDVGLLACMSGLRQEVLLEGDMLFTEFKGALTEQYVCQQLKTLDGVNVYYWTNDRGTAEIDFLVDNGREIVPIEVKAALNLRAKSLRVYREKYAPTHAVRTSMADYKKEAAGLVNLPLWAVETLPQFLA